MVFKICLRTLVDLAVDITARPSSPWGPAARRSGEKVQEAGNCGGEPRIGWPRPLATPPRLVDKNRRAVRTARRSCRLSGSRSKRPGVGLAADAPSLGLDRSQPEAAQDQ